MARPHRLQAPGAVYHVFAHATDGCVLFAQRLDYEVFLLGFAGVLDRHGWACLSYTLMTTHYHVVVQTPAGDIAEGMKRLNGCYAQGFNRRNGRKGHLFGDRYGSVHVTSTEQLKGAVRYVDLNPVEAGLCADPAVWEWGSHAAHFAAVPPPVRVPTDSVLRFFGPTPEVARERYRAFVLDGIAAAKASQSRYGV